MSLSPLLVVPIIQRPSVALGGFSDLFLRVFPQPGTEYVLGQIIFRLFDMDDPEGSLCRGEPVFEETNPLELIPVLSQDYTLSSTSYASATRLRAHWQVTFVPESGSRYAPFTRGCDKTYVSEWGSRLSTIETVLSPASPVVVGEPIINTVTVSGSSTTAPTGTVTFSLFTAPTFCSMPVLGPLAVELVRDPARPSVSVASLTYTPSAAGTLQWVADYSGDDLYQPVPAACPDVAQQSVVTNIPLATPTLAGAGSSPPVALGGGIFNRVVFSGGQAPTGNLVWRVFGPNDLACENVPPLFTTTEQVDGNGTYTTPLPLYVPVLPGSYNWVVEYGGDLNNAAVVLPCGATNQQSTVFTSPPVPPEPTPGQVRRLSRGGRRVAECCSVIVQSASTGRRRCLTRQ